MASSNQDHRKLRLNKNKNKTKDKAYFFLMCCKIQGGQGWSNNSTMASSIFLLGQVALQVASTLKVTSWSQDGCWSSNHQGHILGGKEKGGRGACQMSQLPFKGDFLGTPSKKRTTLAFISLTRIGHGASPTYKGSWEIWM